MARVVSATWQKQRLWLIAIDRDCFILDRLAHKTGDDHAIASCLSWANGIEEAYDRDGKPKFSIGGQAQEFVQEFAGGIRPTAAREEPSSRSSSSLKGILTPLP